MAEYIGRPTDIGRAVQVLQRFLRRPHGAGKEIWQRRLQPVGGTMAQAASGKIRLQLQLKLLMSEPISKILSETVAAPFATTLPETLPGLDVGDGLRRATGRPDRYLPLLESFRRTYRHCLAELSALLAAGDRDATLAFVHKLKGTAGNIGAREVFAVCVALEKDIRAQRDTTALQQRFEQSWTQLLSSLQVLTTSAGRHDPDAAENAR